MIPSLDLTPESCQRRLGLRRQIQMWISAYIATAVVLAMVSAVLALAVGRAQRRVDLIHQQVQLDEDQQRMAHDMLARIDHYEKMIARDRRLSWPFTVADVIASIGAVMPERVTLTTFSFKPRVRGRQRVSTTSAIAEYETIDLELAGVAVDDLDIAAFIAGLQDVELFSSVVMDYARKAKLGVGEAREFGLTCTVDLTVRYVRAEAHEEETP